MNDWTILELGGETVRTREQQGRLAGALYFVMALIGPIGLMVVPGRVFVAGDAAATAQNLRDSEGLMRLGIASELVHQILCIFLLLALYQLFEPVSRGLARQLVVLGALVSVPIVFLNVLNDIAALTIAAGPATLAAFEPTQLDALAYLFLRLHARGLEIASIFWGLWLFPFALLILRSGFIPRPLGYLLMLAGTGYLAKAFTTLTLPGLSGYVSPIAGWLSFGEIPIIFWLLIRGARPDGGAPAERQPFASP